MCIAMLYTFGVLCGPGFRYGGAELKLRAELRVASILSVATALSLQSGLPAEVAALAAAAAMDIAIHLQNCIATPARFKRSEAWLPL